MTIQRLLLRSLLPLLAAAPLAAVAVPGNVTQENSAAVALAKLPDANGPNTRTFTATFTNVTSSEPWVTMILNVWPKETDSCKIAARADTGQITLWTDEGGFIAPAIENWIVPTDPTSAPFHENSSCRVYRSGSNVIQTGPSNTTVILTLKVEIRDSFSGVRYSWAIGGGGDWVWVWVGYIWTVTGQNYIPEPIEITPTSGFAPADTAISYSATVRDWNAALEMWHAELLFTREDSVLEPWEVPKTELCGVVFELNANLMWLKDDSGGQVGGMAHEPGTTELPIYNSRCEVTVPTKDAVPPMIEVIDDYAVRVNFKLKFKSTGWGNGFNGMLKSHLWPVDSRMTGTWSKNNGPWTIGGSSVVNDSFTLNLSPGKQNVAQGEITRYSVTPVSKGYVGAVDIAQPTAPTPQGGNAISGAIVSPTTVNTGQTASIQVNAGSSAPLGPTPLILTATAGNRRVTTVATIEIEGKEVPIKTLNHWLVGPGSTAWEASSAVDPNGRWAMSWKDLSDGSAKLAVYDKGWTTTTLTFPALTEGPTVAFKDDTNLSWDPVRRRFVFALVDTHDMIRYGYQAADGTWVTDCPVVFPRVPFNPSFPFQEGWDYPSVAVTNDGRIAIGATKKVVPNTVEAFYSRVSTASGTGCPVWGSIQKLEGVGGDLAGARLIAAGNNLHGFGASAFQGSLQTIRHSAYNNTTQAWSSSSVVVDLPGVAVAQSVYTGSPQIFLGRLFSVAGRGDGNWIVVYQQRYPELPPGTDFNNVWTCTSWASPCAAAEPEPAHQFMPEVAFADDGYWVSFFRFVSSNPPRLNTRIRFTPGLSGTTRLGWLANLDNGSNTPLEIDPNGWTFSASYPRCNGAPCLALGDYNTIASGGDSTMVFPYVGGPGQFQQGAQVQDPPAPTTGTSPARSRVERRTGRSSSPRREVR